MPNDYAERRRFLRGPRPYLEASQARAWDRAKELERQQERVCGTCAHFSPTPELVPNGVCGSTGEIVASVWSRPCWQAKTVPTDPANPAAILPMGCR